MPTRAPYDWAAAVHAEMVPQMTTATQMSLASQRTGSQPRQVSCGQVATCDGTGSRMHSTHRVQGD